MTAVGADHVLIYDANQTALKKALVSTLGNTISNSANNRVLTDTGTTGSINAESALTFDGTTLGTNALTASGTVTAAGFTIGSAAINEAELEILDGATITTNELNALASIGSDSVATQLATKAPLASPSLTGTATGVNLTLSGNLIVNGTTTTVATTNTTVSDNMLELNTGSSSNANDCGLVIERGSTGDNAIFAWDESADRFILGTTTATGASTGDLTIAAAKLEVSGIVIGSADINETELEILDGATLSTTELNYVDGVTSSIQSQIDSKLATAGGTMTGDLIVPDGVKIEVGNATGGDLQIYHDGVNSFIENKTGSFKINGDDIHFMNKADNETMLDMAVNGAVSLFFDNDKKLETVTGGVTVSGTATATTFSGSGASLTSLNASNISSGTINSARLPGGIGKVLQVAVFSNQDQFSTTSNIPADGTTPTISEGIQVASRTFTPTATNSTLIHVINAFAGGNSGGAIKSFNIFRGSTNIGAFADITGDSGHFHCLMGQTTESAATTSEITYTLRFGTNNNTVYWNRSSGTNGVTASNPSNSSLRWIIYEIGA